MGTMTTLEELKYNKDHTKAIAHDVWLELQTAGRRHLQYDADPVIYKELSRLREAYRVAKGAANKANGELLRYED